MEISLTSQTFNLDYTNLATRLNTIPTISLDSLSNPNTIFPASITGNYVKIYSVHSSELQYYTKRPSNVQLSGDGNLIITAIKESFSGASYTSARIKTKGLFSQTYGRFEARIKTPTGPGIWPAFWLLGDNIDQVNWPMCGEIDIMEQRGQQSAITHGSIHGPGNFGANAITKGYGLTSGRFDTDFHIYAVEWGEDYIDFYIDTYLYQRIKTENISGKWVFNTPFFMILNVAVGGNYVGYPTSGTPFPQSMYIDYVKVYKHS
jgi:beta-glucanase (GH16 family)